MLDRVTAAHSTQAPRRCWPAFPSTCFRRAPRPVGGGHPHGEPIRLSEGATGCPGSRTPVRPRSASLMPTATTIGSRRGRIGCDESRRGHTLAPETAACACHRTVMCSFLVSASGYANGQLDNVVVWIDGDVALVNRVAGPSPLSPTPVDWRSLPPRTRPCTRVGIRQRPITAWSCSTPTAAPERGRVGRAAARRLGRVARSAPCADRVGPSDHGRRSRRSRWFGQRRLLTPGVARVAAPACRMTGTTVGAVLHREEAVRGAPQTARGDQQLRSTDRRLQGTCDDRPRG